MDQNQGTAVEADRDAPDYTGPNYPQRESESHVVAHRRVLDLSRLATTRARSGLTLQQVAERLAEEAFAVDVEFYEGHAALIPLWEDGAVPVPGWAIFAFGSIYGVSIESLGECLSCRETALGIAPTVTR